MDREKERLERIFPDYFERYHLPPEGAREEVIQVYRACRTNKLEKESFLPTYEERGCIFFDETEKEDPGTFSLSTFEKARDVKHFAAMNSEFHPPYRIAIGKTMPVHGVVQRSKERDGVKYKRASHVDWWLYKNAEPYKEFELIDDFMAYYEEMKRTREKEVRENV